MNPIPVILDTDPGVDDALALMLALRSPELDVLGICTVSGNVPVAVGTCNALKVLGLLKRLNVPVYQGADKPLKRDPVYATAVHGEDGLGGAVLPNPEIKATDGAVDFLIETISARPHEITLIAVGPLTNLALAEQHMPGILKKTKRIIVMGGAISEPGNVTPTAEFNFFADPHAAQIVVRSGAVLILVPLDVTHRVGLTEPVIDNRILPLGTPEAKFVVEATQKLLALGEKSGRHRVVFLHDPMAVAMAIDAAMFQTVILPIDVETEGVLTLGQVVVDRRACVLGGKHKGYSTGCAMGVNKDVLLHLFLSRILNLTDG